MVKNQSRSNRKATGGRYKRLFVRRQHESGGEPALTRIDADKSRTTRTLGGSEKTKLLSTRTAQVVGKNGKRQEATITSVKENPANRHFVRRNIITKGTVIETDKGLAKVTSRPGQTGTIQAVLLE